MEGFNVDKNGTLMVLIFIKFKQKDEFLKRIKDVKVQKLLSGMLEFDISQRITYKDALRMIVDLD